ncbi:hypothetical protein MKW94_010553 [Papaver nudicaule]|uniref:Cyclin N-terminal domain-containing protein n=1 Tax=Papaver nudicaule TaxID=74823 RepID=A0AA41VFA8_PAPNU|nr:hypothetical protein [Papaver nudicaule]
MSSLKSCSDYILPDLLCYDEDAESLSLELDDIDYGNESLSTQYSFPCDIEESIARFIEEEGEYVPGFDYGSKFKSETLDSFARQESIEWILKVYTFFRFQPLTAYLAVNYMDRFLASRSFPQSNGWPLKLLSVACLSLAAKMEEPIVPSLLDLQVYGATNPKFIFEHQTIRRMELMVLSALDWRLRSITPFTFIDFFAYKLDSTGTLINYLVSRATKIILHIIREVSFIEYYASTIAVAAIVRAANEIPVLSSSTLAHNPGKAAEWCHGLNKESIVSCYDLMEDVVTEINQRSSRLTPKILPQVRITTQTIGFSDSSSSPSSSPSSSQKRRKLNNLFWVDNSDYEDKDKL